MRFTLFWIREDGQGDFDMGTFASRDAALAAIPASRHDLVDQAPGPVGSDEWASHCAEIDAGKWVVVATMKGKRNVGI